MASSESMELSFLRLFIAFTLGFRRPRTLSYTRSGNASKGPVPCSLLTLYPVISVNTWLSHDPQVLMLLITWLSHDYLMHANQSSWLLNDSCVCYQSHNYHTVSTHFIWLLPDCHMTHTYRSTGRTAMWSSVYLPPCQNSKTDHLTSTRGWSTTVGVRMSVCVVAMVNVQPFLNMVW